jgi:PAS domain S-box-containing protein
VMVDITAQREAESAAKTATDQLRELVEQGPAVLFGYTVGGDPPEPHVDFLSPRLGQLLGLPSSAPLSDLRRWFEMIHPDDRERVSLSAERAWKTGADWDDEYRMLGANGEIVWIWDLGRCVRRGPGQPFRFVGAVIDITERRLETDRMTRRLDTLEALQRGVPGVSWSMVVDPVTESSRFTYMSPGCLELTGYSAEELLTERNHFRRLLHPDDAERVSALDAESDETGTWDATYRIVHRDGSVRWLHSVGRRGAGTEPDTVVWHGVALDVTAQMEATEAAEAAPVAEVAPPI